MLNYISGLPVDNLLLTPSGVTVLEAGTPGGGTSAHTGVTLIG